MVRYDASHCAIILSQMHVMRGVNEHFRPLSIRYISMRRAFVHVLQWQVSYHGQSVEI